MSKDIQAEIYVPYLDHDKHLITKFNLPAGTSITVENHHERKERMLQWSDIVDAVSQR